jgi:hypothetical protein
MLSVTEIDEKFVRHSFSLPPELLDRMRGVTDNMSAYVRQLIENDLAGKLTQPEALSPTIIADLARVLSGEIDAQIIAKKLGSANQPMMLRQWVRELAESDPDDSEPLDIRGEHAKQEPIARRVLREKAERRAKREGGAA